MAHSDAPKHGMSASQITLLTQKTLQAKSKAYCPYSNFHVGAVVLATDGTFVSGANIENASYPVTICAERVAMAKAVSDGHRSFKALGVATNIAPPASPCGMCRQFIREFCSLDMPVFMHDPEGNYVVMTVEELLPMSFGPEALLPPAVLAASATGPKAEAGGGQSLEED